MPRTMIVREWEEFVKHVDSIEFRVRRIKMQENRSKHTTPHTICREGYARLEVKLQIVKLVQGGRGGCRG